MNKNIENFDETLIAKFAIQIGFDLLPKEVIKRVKDIFRDTIGIMVRIKFEKNLGRKRFWGMYRFRFQF
jgi:hypothetical protein